MTSKSVSNLVSGKHLTGRVFLNTSELKKNRRKMGFSQMDFADYSTSIRQPISIASIKRAELGHPVIYRTALKLAKLFSVDISEIISATEPIVDVWQIEEQKNEKKQSTMIGRKGEVNYLNYLISKSKKMNSGKVVCIEGEAGVGKTRFIEEVKHHISKNEIICQEFKFNKQQDIKEFIKKIWFILLQLNSVKIINSGEVERRNENLNLGGMLSEYKKFEEMVMQSGMNGVKENYIKFYAEKNDTTYDFIVSQEPSQEMSVVVVEDAHLASEQASQCLLQIIKYTSSLPITWIMTARNEKFEFEFMNFLKINGFQCHLINLVPLMSGEIHDYISQNHSMMLGRLDVLMKQSNGNPLLLKKALAIDEDIGMDACIEEIVDYKIEGLSEKDYYVAQVIAVYGKAVNLLNLRRLLGDEAYYPRDPVKFGLLKIDPQMKVSFINDLIMAGVHSKLSADASQKIHEQIAKYFEMENETACAFHLFKAKNQQAPAKILDAVIENTVQLKFTKAHQLIADYKSIDFAPINLYKCLMLEGEVLFQLEESKKSQIAYEKAIELAENPREEMAAWVELAGVCHLSLAFDVENTQLERSVTQAKALNDQQALARLLNLQGNLYFKNNDQFSADQIYSEALDLAKKNGDSKSEAVALLGLGRVYFSMGRMRSSYQFLTESQIIFDKLKLSYLSATNLDILANAKFYLNQTHDALLDAKASLTIATEKGHTLVELPARLTLGFLYTSFHKNKDALLEFETSRNLLNPKNNTDYEAVVYEGLAKGHFINGEFEEGFHYAVKAWQTTEKQGLLNKRGPRILGMLALLEKDPHSRQQYISKGLEILSTVCDAQNHFSFYVTASEASILARNASQASQLADKFEAYTSKEPCDWSIHHIELIRSHVRDLLNPFSGRSAKTAALIQQGIDLGLVGASPVLHGLYQ